MLLTKLAAHFKAATDDHQLLSEAAAARMVDTARAEERTAASNVTPHERHLAWLQAFFSLYDPGKADSAASLLEQYEADDRVPVLFGLLERKYKAPVRPATGMVRRPAPPLNSTI